MIAILTTILVIIIASYVLYRLFFYFKRKGKADWIEQDDFQANMRTAQIIDVREKEDYNRGHILGARSVPYTVARTHKEYLLAIRKDKPVYLYDNKDSMAIYMAGLLKISI